MKLYLVLSTVLCVLAWASKYTTDQSCDTYSEAY